jgi:hypothetical protein
MVALLEKGAIRACWLLDPLEGTYAIAEAGGGASFNGVPIRVGGVDCPMPSGLRGSVLMRFLPAAVLASVERQIADLGAVLPGVTCAVVRP